VRAEIVEGRSQITDPYALLKALTRGRRVGASELAEFVRGLDIGDATWCDIDTVTDLQAAELALLGTATTPDVLA